MRNAQTARGLVMEYGWNATAYQILNPGISHWFSAEAPGVVGYVTRGRRWVVAGAPVCAAGALSVVTRELEREAGALGNRVCYMAAGARLETHLKASHGHSRVALGAQPVWDPAGWEDILRNRPSLRAQLARARHKEVEVLEMEAQFARGDAELRACLGEWVDARPMLAMHFLVEPATFLGELADRILLVARRGGRVVGFLMASPVPQRGGYLVEQIIRNPSAPNGTAELLIDGLMRKLAGMQCGYVTMGLVPLSGQAGGMRENPWWLRMAMGWARAHGRRFYHFDGLEQFRLKMCPAYWEPIYAISNEPTFTPGAFWAMVAAFAEGSLAVMLGKSLVRAMGVEVRRFGARVGAAAAEGWRGAELK